MGKHLGHEPAVVAGSAGTLAGEFLGCYGDTPARMPALAVRFVESPVFLSDRLTARKPGSAGVSPAS